MAEKRKRDSSQMKFKKRVEKWNKLLLESYEIHLKLHREFDEVYKELNKLENANTEE